MSAVNDTIEAGGATPPATIKVWDPFIRVFHWSLATLFLVAYATGDEVEQVHIACRLCHCRSGRRALHLGVHR